MSQYFTKTNEASYTFGNIDDGDRNILIQEKKICGEDPSKCVFLSITFGCVFFIIAIVIIALYAEKMKPDNSAANAITKAQPLLGNVTVFYAASLVNLMTKNINPGFTNTAHYRVNTQAAASGVLAMQLIQGISTDIFISASATYDTTLSTTTIPSTGKTVLSWWATWGSTRLGIGYNINSPHIANFQAIANGSLPWYIGINPSTMKIGRTDPDLDPKGARIVIMTKLAQLYYNTSYSIESTILGSDRNPLQLYAEQQLENLLDAGNLDVGFFYECEQTWKGNVQFMSLPNHLDFSNSSLNEYYKKANYTSQAMKTVTQGSAIVFTISILNNAINKNTAILYVENLLSLKTASFFNHSGLYKAHPVFSGNKSAIPMKLLKYQLL